MGKGALHWKNGEKYVGEFQNDLYHGYGVLTFAENSTGLIYDGECPLVIKECCAPIKLFGQAPNHLQPER